MPRTSCPPTSLALPADHPGMLGRRQIPAGSQGKGYGDHAESAYCVVDEQ
jgi:hypothetical protein